VTGRTELLSITNLRFSSADFIDRFRIQTTGVEILAACHVPKGWHVTLGNHDVVSGDLFGEAGAADSFIGVRARNLGELQNLFLVRVYDFVDRWQGGLPPTYQLSVSVGRYGSGEPDHERQLNEYNLGRVAAAACPAPR
jgi:hypothetical protein